MVVENSNMSLPCRHSRPRRVLELFSGIGGMSYALKSINLESPVEIIACDINTIANDVHQFNFPDKVILNKNLAGITAAEIDSLDVDMWTMSPPCQPFTRIGLQRDVEDNRTDCLKQLLDIFPALKKKPQFFLLENVCGFETSVAHDLLIKTLNDEGYSWTEFLLCPTQIGVPNSRLRYYFIARKDDSFVISNRTLHVDVPSLDRDKVCRSCLDSLFPGSYKEEEKDINIVHPTVSLEDVLEKVVPNEFFLSPKELKYLAAMDVVTVKSKRTCCFTRGYGHLMQKAGSVLQENTELDVSTVFDATKLVTFEEGMKSLMSLCLRFFTPVEVSRLLCFPDDFSFPSSTTRKQRYRLLGNSVNVRVVALIMRFLFLYANDHEN